MGLKLIDQFIFDFHSCCKMLFDKNMVVQKDDCHEQVGLNFQN